MWLLEVEKASISCQNKVKKLLWSSQIMHQRAVAA